MLKKSVQEMQDEEAFVTTGPLHPIPAQAPRYMGPVPPAASSASLANSNAGGSNMVVDDQGRAHKVQVNPVAPVDPVAPLVVVDGTIGMNVEIS